MSAPRDPWSTGPSAADEPAHDTTQPNIGDAASSASGAPEPDDRTAIRTSDGTVTRRTWPGDADRPDDPNATQIRSADRPDSGANPWPPLPHGSSADDTSSADPSSHAPHPGDAGPTQSASPTDDQRAHPQPGYAPSHGPGQDRQLGLGQQSQQGYGQSQQGYGQQSHGASGYGPAGPATTSNQPQRGYEPPGYYPTPTTSTKAKRKRPLVIGLVAVLLLALGTAGFLVLRPSSSPAFTFAGKKIGNADAVLTAAQSTTMKLVASRHGAANSDTRCYFARSTTPAAGTKKSDIDANVYCGPVLFVDGDKDKTYVSYPLTRAGTTGGAVTLSASTTPSSPQPQSAPSGRTLARPDKVEATSTSTLAPPTPPPAPANAFSTTADITGQSLKTAPSDAVIGSRSGGVQISNLGPITRYGQGDDARSAPNGQQLIAFKTTAGPDEDGTNRFPYGAITVSAGGESHAVPKSAATVVVAVPTATKAVDLVVDDAGLTQKISLLTGRPAATNVAVGRRHHRAGPSAGSKAITFTVSSGSDQVTRRARATMLGVDLRYWVRIGDNRHAASTGTALLYVDMEYSYTQALKKPFTGSASNGPYGFAPQLLTLRLPSGQVVAARNYSTTTDKLYILFAVPASFTSGRIVMSGNEAANKNGVALGIQGAPYFDVHVPAG